MSPSTATVPGDPSSPPGSRAQQLIAALGLTPHPEGGWYREVFRSNARVQPADDRPARDALTSIYFLLQGGQFSRWHRVLSDEVWIHLEGAPIALWTCDAGLQAAPAQTRLGPVDGDATRPQHTVPVGQWQAARLITMEGSPDYALVACTVGPGFDFADFSFMEPAGDEAWRMGQLGAEFAALV
jgi:predicted cupin superfamily sugar epimerase